ncbi:hypothetical protein N866_13565 [Actinotalea ferrariae CF5-4]|uniref:Uncharacterized protein n=1 Tax=Actinotalea ferrariae CF5-4 TaxID=948458 RepID=A0A021VT19_9CELL|nr:hypothetical protein [Actinotalea ferrariae]EYR64273.1 hypothetical protein N866_13565 [Actinotalea ferrariae CF5-4]
MIKWRQTPRRPRISPADLSTLDRLDGVRLPDDSAFREGVFHRHIGHLIVAADWHRGKGHGPHTILAFLDSPETRRIYCPEAVAVVATLVGGGSR